ncbi:right-handed parallel beta-helix repeat-containing protein [Marinirhabdus gelatinilytica]|uniref:Putative secreted protein (Por secretion system target) n=1 Tax=Marinirhabdus gelatinilytica TaxID=1703343 RepID=A0A370Q7J3_9FLAO|nr:hypothetical protein [Marinirhabdus gelatinilytica]RDK84313.1 putative secreted protein (Por secretion system target) [Marinirhabdus gelatinilytica]
MKKITTLLFIMVAFSNLTAADLLVPSQYSTIQAAIDVANTGDVVIVSPGTYFENIDFLGKAILVTSTFHLSQNPLDITNTIINGSQPTDPEFGSCVSFVNGEIEDSILKGFTITGGTGTKTYNPSEDLYFRTGGGILINESSPTIVHNVIRNNEAIAEAGVFGAGGGGIRMGFGVPVIENNVIKNNTGGYAGGIMIAYCEGAVLKNNIIANNTATGSFNGGGGVYVDWEPITLENNTIVGNYSGDRGGGIISTGTTTIIKNCIIYGNEAAVDADQIFKRFGGNAETTYCNIEDGFDGTGSEEGNIDEDPEFINTNNYYLQSSSPCIDAGNADPNFNDIEDPNNPGNALFPAMGGLRNDIGAYGGAGASEMLSVTETFLPTKFSIKASNPYDNSGLHITVAKNTQADIWFYSLLGQPKLLAKEISLTEGNNIIKVEIPTSGLVIVRTVNGHSATTKLFKE